MKILLIALSGIGDALMFTPALRFLKESYPDCQTDALVMIKGVKEIYERNPDINSVYHFDFMREGGARSLKYLASFRKKYDASINVYPSNRKEYNIISSLIGAKKRAAVKYNRMDKQNFGFLNNIRIEEDDNRHNVLTNIFMVEKLFGKKSEKEFPLQFYLSEGDKLFSEILLKKKNINDKDLVIGFHPGCATLKNHIKRRWEPEKFAKLGKQLIKETGAKIFLFGGPEEKELKGSIYKMIDQENVTVIETDNLPQSAAVMKRCNLFITNDSSLMHVSSSLGLKVVAIIGPTNPAFIHPWKTEFKIVSLDLDCAPCFFYSPKPLICYRDDVLFKCIKELDVDKVYSASRELLEQN